MTRKRAVVTPNKLDTQALGVAVASQGNAVPEAVATTLRLVAPIIARLAIRYVARHARKRISDSAVNSASNAMYGVVDDLVNKYGVKRK